MAKKKLKMSISCPYCGCDKTYVVRAVKDGESILRRRRCDNPECKKLFHTIEADAAESESYVRKRFEYIFYGSRSDPEQ